MADISIPQNQDYFRITYTLPNGDTVYKNHVEFERVPLSLEVARVFGRKIEKIEHIVVEVTVVDVTGVFTQPV